MPSTPQTIVIIDDDDSVRRARRRLLRSVGMDVEAFATAEDFLQANAPLVAACLVLDVHLPGLSGLELQQQLKTAGRSIPIVFITAYEDEQTCALALREGAIAFLQKPFEEQGLLDALARALS